MRARKSFAVCRYPAANTLSCHITHQKQHTQKKAITTLMSLMNEIHRNQINVKQLIIVFDTIKRVIFSPYTLCLSDEASRAFNENVRGSMLSSGLMLHRSW